MLLKRNRKIDIETLFDILRTVLYGRFNQELKSVTQPQE